MTSLHAWSKHLKYAKDDFSSIFQSGEREKKIIHWLFPANDIENHVRFVSMYGDKIEALGDAIPSARWLEDKRPSYCKHVSERDLRTGRCNKCSPVQENYNVLLTMVKAICPEAASKLPNTAFK